jgi:hypothetical protein
MMNKKLFGHLLTVAVKSCEHAVAELRCMLLLHVKYKGRAHSSELVTLLTSAVPRTSTNVVCSPPAEQIQPSQQGFSEHVTFQVRHRCSV